MTGIPDSPYKGLASFEDSELDALLFFGREREAATVAANVLASRLTVLYGPSGVGKSSLLHAGVARRLRELSGAPVVVHDSWAEDPASGLIASVRGECGELGATAGLVDTVAAAAHQTGELHLLLLGYTLSDWTLRVVLERLWGEEPLGYRSWSVHAGPLPLEREFWRRRGVELVEVAPAEYLAELERVVG